MFSQPAIKVPRSAYSINLQKLAELKPLQARPDFPMIDTFPHGAPLGGFGAGNFSRSPYGDFNIWHLFPGVHIHRPLDFCGMAVFRRTGRRAEACALSLRSPLWPGRKLNPRKCAYAALYPKSWYKYAELDVTVEQFSPVLPHNYRETAYPVACFNVQFCNRQKKAQEIAVLFSWQNLAGLGYDLGENVTRHKFKKTSVRRWNERRSEEEYQAIVFKADPAKGDALNGEMCLMTRVPEGAVVSFCTQYDTTQPPDAVWEPFAARGILHERSAEEYELPAGAIAVKVCLNPGETFTVPFALAWDLPRCLNGRVARYYTKYWDESGGNAFAIARETLGRQKEYAADIAKWQSAVTKKMPAAIAGALFNELYYLADGGSLWDAKSGMYSFLECFDYPFYETLDVRFYGAFPLAKFWPEIEKRIIREFNRTIYVEDAALITYHAQAAVQDNVTVSGEHNRKFIQQDLRKRRYALPHDLGSPAEAPWKKINAYTWQNANRWKDLNSKYVLQVYRAYYYSGKKDHAFLAEIWPGIVKAIEYLNVLDVDEDGLPENESFPDQTFDNWLMRGTSAYCGILRLASLQTAVQIAEVIGQKEQAQAWRRLLKKAKDALNQKLWNGRYFRFDEHSENIMAAQLTGQWYLEQLRLPAVLEDWQIDSALKNIYRQNFLRVEQGRRGLINGRTAAGLPISAAQADDAWTGVNCMFAAHLFLRGQRGKAERLLKNMVKILQQGGMLFRTPEAWDLRKRQYLASMYMRPGVIWALADWY